MPVRYVVAGEGEPLYPHAADRHDDEDEAEDEEDQPVDRCRQEYPLEVGDALRR